MKRYAASLRNCGASSMRYAQACVSHRTGTDVMRTRDTKVRHTASLGLLFACVMASTALADEPAEAKVSGGPYTLQPTRIAGGGGSAAGAAFTVRGTVGQHDA